MLCATRYKESKQWRQVNSTLSSSNTTHVRDVLYVGSITPLITCYLLLQTVNWIGYESIRISRRPSGRSSNSCIHHSTYKPPCLELTETDDATSPPSSQSRLYRLLNFIAYFIGVRAPFFNTTNVRISSEWSSRSRVFPNRTPSAFVCFDLSAWSATYIIKLSHRFTHPSTNEPTHPLTHPPIHQPIR